MVTMGVRMLTHGFMGGGKQHSPQQMEQMELGLLDIHVQEIVIVNLDPYLTPYTTSHQLP